MDYLQYICYIKGYVDTYKGFKPYYKWITFNTETPKKKYMVSVGSFKPYYKWITFNTKLHE